ncbi:hypothetical protein [Neobacillus ginsengisoli]|uniref:Cobalamin biosynthesis protein CobT n=1 Tax=Neobacillus ginsengisoli TaxID=904295 RepID=A0ABT9Y1L1_9BACI|nr:hypothetical protein [Neobacillus ginsengisoli]MDQ0201405.1 cobalamin biosynthesis protein CobT [Neobacillus ginsengisoli]
MLLISIVIIILLVHFLIIRPLTQRNRPQRMDRRRGYYEQPEYYGSSGGNGGLGKFGSFAGGIAAGALLTYLFEQGRIGFNQYNAWQHLEDQEIMQELMDQNILQEHEIAQLQEEVGHPENDQQSAWDNDNRDNNQDFDYDDQDYQQNDGSNNWNSETDNWV